MRVLFISKIPYPLHTGGHIRTFNLIKNVSRYCELTLLAPMLAWSDLRNTAKLEPFCSRIVPIASTIRTPIKKYLGVMKNAFLTNKPYITDAYVNREFLRTLTNLLRAEAFEVVHCDSISLAKFIFGMKQVTNAAFVINEHNVEHIIWERYFSTAEGLMKRLYYKGQCKRLYKTEGDICRSYDWVIAVSNRDAHIIRKRFKIDSVSVVENGVDTGYFRPVNGKKSDPYNLMFSGSMDWRPNCDAVAYFLEHSYPLMLSRLPHISLTIVGRDPDPAICRLAGRFSNVEVTGTVKDVRPFLHNCSVFVVPLRIGGGSRLKILEAMAAGKPVVSTYVGAEGLEVKEGRDIVLARDGVDFAEKCISLLLDRQKQVQLGENGRRLVTRRYDWREMSSRLVDVWKEAADSGAK